MEIYLRKIAWNKIYMYAHKISTCFDASGEGIKGSSPSIYSESGHAHVSIFIL